MNEIVGSHKEFEEKVKEMANDSIFIDYLVGLSYYTLENEKIFRILKKYGARYYIISGGALPFKTAVGQSLSGTYMAVLTAIKKGLNIRRLIGFVSRKIIMLLTKYSNLYSLPHKIFSGNSEILQDYIRRYKKVRNCVIPIHSLDYDAYLRYIGCNPSLANTATDKNCVFLDETATGHPDDNVMGMQPLEKEPYFRSIKRLFDKIERETGLEVIIAAHPFSAYEKTPGVFGNRKIIKGKTVDLVSRTSLVVMHSSTAINYAILFRRPILFVKTDDMIKKGRSFLVDVMATAVGMHVVNIDDEEMLNNIPLNYVSWPRNRYDEYMYKYIKTKDIAEKSTWEFVAEEAE